MDFINEIFAALEAAIKKLYEATTSLAQAKSQPDPIQIALHRHTPLYCSHIRTEAATPALSDSLPSCIGMITL